VWQKPKIVTKFKGVTLWHFEWHKMSQNVLLNPWYKITFTFYVWISLETPLSPPSFDGSQLWRSMSVCSSLYLLTPAHCARDPSVVGLVPPITCCRRTQSPDCALRIPVSHERRQPRNFENVKLVARWRVHFRIFLAIFWLLNSLQKEEFWYRRIHSLLINGVVTASISKSASVGFKWDIPLVVRCFL